MRVQSTDGVELELHDFGGDGPPLLISHATGFLAAVYGPLAAELGRHFHVWAIDFRGHGDSTARADGDQGWHGMTQDLLACVDALDTTGVTGPFVGFGHSMGGAVTLDAARLRPGTFRSIVAFEPIVPPTAAAPGMQARDNHMSGPARRRRPSFASASDALARYAARPPLDQFRADVLWRYVTDGFRELPDGGVTLKCTPEAEAGTFEGAGSLTQDDLGGIDAPVLVMLGARQPELPPAQFAPKVAAALPRGELLEYPTFGHFGPFQDPLRIALDLIGFADRV